ncbi:FUSC family protein [Bacillus atrophaeus]|uniref:FUSC family protein n=1 Tax=Bacillus atrophaeus TaxID=1452 RepID=UPI000D04F0CB|nr:FUSC family protein [Bacillus atrophaeus]PSA90761.1 FUSC family protein [Bacillus atrophaeus]
MNKYSEKDNETKQRVAPAQPVPSGIKDVFCINANPLPWKRAVGSGIASGFPIFIGALLGHVDYGLAASIGGFTYLYTGGEPYSKRAVKLLLVAIGLAVSFGLGTLLAGTFWSMAIVLGLIGAAAVFTFGAFGIQGPAPMFFVLAFLVSSGLPVDPSEAPLRAGLAFLGGLFAWIIAMLGWLFDRHGPETAVLQKTYRQLAACLSAVGTPNFHSAQHQTVLMLRTARLTVLGRGNKRKSSRHTERLIRLLQKAEDMFMAIIHFSAEAPKADTEEMVTVIRNVADLLGYSKVAAEIKLQPSKHETEAHEKLYGEINAVLLAASDQLDDPLSAEPSRLQSAGFFLRNAFDWHSPVLIRALKYGIVLAAAALFANALGFHRSYWIPLSSAAVMLGTTVVFTMHRAIQRSIGTVLGIMLASAILFLKPEGMYIALCVTVLQFLLEMFIVRNYVLAVPFLTANALIITESMHADIAVSYFITARLTDVVLGSVIGFLGAMLLWRRFSSNRLQELLSDVIQQEGRYLQKLLSFEEAGQEADGHKLRVSLVKLRDLFDTSLGEYPKTNIDNLWPAVAGAQHLGYFLISASNHRRHKPVSKEELNRLKELFDSMAQAALKREKPIDTEVPRVESYPRISEELSAMYQGLRTAYEH